MRGFRKSVPLRSVGTFIPSLSPIEPIELTSKSRQTAMALLKIRNEPALRGFRIVSYSGFSPALFSGPLGYD